MRPAVKQTASISLNITFLSVERGFDFVTIFACPDGVCRELKKYSDYDLRTEMFPRTDEFSPQVTLKYFGDSVQCGSIVVNTNELRIQFTSDGESIEDPIEGAPSALKYTGFTAAYWSSPHAAAEEQIGCPERNYTFREAQGSVFAVDKQQVLPHGLSSSSEFISQPFRSQFWDRFCHDQGYSDPLWCTVVARGQSPWWIIAPPKPAPGTVHKIVLAFRDVFLEDSMDILHVYTSTNNVTKKETTVSGMNPFRGHMAIKCTGCSIGCSRYTGATGVLEETAQELYDQKRNCVWIIDAASAGYAYVHVSFDHSFDTGAGHTIVEACHDTMCHSKSSIVDFPCDYTGAALPSMIVSPTGIIKLSFASDGGSAGFRATWAGACPYNAYTSPSGTLTDGWGGSYPAWTQCDYKIFPVGATSVTVNFTYVEFLSDWDQVDVFSGVYEQLRYVRTDHLGVVSASSDQFVFTSNTGGVIVRFTSWAHECSTSTGGFELSWTSTSSILAPEAAEAAQSPEQAEVRMAPLETCNYMIFEADEVLLNLQTIFMPTNSCGFWLDYWVHSSPAQQQQQQQQQQPSVEGLYTSCDAQSMSLRHYPEYMWVGTAGYLLGSSFFSIGWRAVQDVSSVAPNGRLEWVVKRPSPDARSVTIYPTDIDLETSADFMTIFACKGGNCTQLHRPMTGRIVGSALFCNIRQNADEIRVVLKFDATNNLYSTVRSLSWEWHREPFEETTAGECPSVTFFDQPSGRAFLDVAASIPSEQTWIFSPGPGTKAITLDFTQVALPWYSTLVFRWACYEGSCRASQSLTMSPFGLQSCAALDDSGNTKNIYECFTDACTSDSCYIPVPQLCTFVFPSEEVHVKVTLSEESNTVDHPKTPSRDGAIKALNVTYTSSTSLAPEAVFDGDCRLKVEGAHNLLTHTAGNIVFDWAAWMKRASSTNVTCMGHAIRGSRVRWVIRPLQPTMTIVLSFKSIDLSPDDVLYVNPDCNNNMMFAFSHSQDGNVHTADRRARILNGRDNLQYRDTEVPCPVTIRAQCIVLELDISRSFARGSQYLEKAFKGFSASYKSFTSLEGPESPLQVDVCLPADLKVSSPKPRFVWNELCCAQEDGNSVFPGNFYGDLSIQIDLADSDNEEDYKVIYRVEPYSAAGAVQLDDFKCEQEYFDAVEGWYPSERSEYERQLMLMERWNAYHTEPYPNQIRDDDAPVAICKLWYSERKFVKLRGKPQVVQRSSILLNAPRASADRPLTVPAMYDHVMVSAVTCRAIKVGNRISWLKSEIAVMDQKFVLGPSLTVNVSLSDQPAHLVNFKEDSFNVTEQLLLSQPLIAAASAEVSKILNLPDRPLGVLKQVDAVDISIAHAVTRRRAGAKTAIVAKPGFNRTAWYAETSRDVDADTQDDAGLYDVNVTFSILARSVQQASSFANLLSQARRQQLLWPVQVQVQMPDSLKVGEGGACKSHYHCAGTGLFCSSRQVCEPCRFCSIDAFDSIDGICPQTLCPKSGGFPECVDGEKLLDEIGKCKSSYAFSVWRYGDPKMRVAPEVKPKAKPRPKYITPFNRLVGAVSVTQRRRRQANCSVENPYMDKYLQTTGATCQSTEGTDASPFSLDPTFQRFSQVYNGKLVVESTYFDSERANDQDRSPFAFFPHQHDVFLSKGAVSNRRLAARPRKLTIVDPTMTDHTKDAKWIHEPSRDLFKLYFDELPTGRHGDKMLAYLRDGKFIDSRCACACGVFRG
jgi:hypothetical protein